MSYIKKGVNQANKLTQQILEIPTAATVFQGWSQSRCLRHLEVCVDTGVTEVNTNCLTQYYPASRRFYRRVQKRSCRSPEPYATLHLFCAAQTSVRDIACRVGELLRRIANPSGAGRYLIDERPLPETHHCCNSQPLRAERSVGGVSALCCGAAARASMQAGPDLSMRNPIQLCGREVVPSESPTLTLC